MNLSPVENGTNKIYTAQIMDDDSFEIEKLHMTVDTAVFALQHFVIA
jgi:hypothetical protein